jgi:hypothetical protein
MKLKLLALAGLMMAMNCYADMGVMYCVANYDSNHNYECMDGMHIISIKDYFNKHKPANANEITRLYVFEGPSGFEDIYIYYQ